MNRLKRMIPVLALIALMLVCAQGWAEEAPAELTLMREFSGDYAVYGDWITLSYTVRNLSEETIKAVTVTDPLIGEVGYLAQMEAGSRKVFSARIRVTTDCLSKPSAEYTVGKAVKTVEVEPGTICLEEVSLTPTLLSADGALTLTVANDGNAPVTGVKAVDRVLGDMGEAALCLAPGETITFSRGLPDGSVGPFECSVSAVCAGGRVVTVSSNTVYAEEQAEDDTDGGISLSVLQDEIGGQVTVTVSNETAQLIRDAVLTELTSNEVRPVRFLPAKSMTQVLWTGAVPDGQMCFELTMPDGQSVSAEPFDASAQMREERQADAGVPLADGPSYQSAENPQTYQTMMLAAGFVLTAMLLVWWIVSQINKYREQRRRIKKKQENRKKQRSRAQKNKDRKNEGKKA